METLQQIAERMFNAYNAQGPNPNKTWDGKDVPKWADIGEQVQGKWMAAASSQGNISKHMDFGQALLLLRSGEKVARAGWNGKGMWLALSPGKQALPANSFWAGPNCDYARANGGAADVLPCITMKTATGEILMGWLASQTDMLAEDWDVVP